MGDLRRDQRPPDLDRRHRRGNAGAPSPRRVLELRRPVRCLRTADRRLPADRLRPSRSRAHRRHRRAVPLCRHDRRRPLVCSSTRAAMRPTSSATATAASSRSSLALARPDLVRSLVLIGTNYHYDGIVPGVFDDFGPDSDTFAFLQPGYAERSPDGGDTSRRRRQGSGDVHDRADAHHRRPRAHTDACARDGRRRRRRRARRTRGRSTSRFPGQLAVVPARRTSCRTRSPRSSRNWSATSFAPAARSRR